MIRFNSVLIQDNKIDFCYNDNIIYTLYYRKNGKQRENQQLCICHNRGGSKQTDKERQNKYSLINPIIY